MKRYQMTLYQLPESCEFKPMVLVQFWSNWRSRSGDRSTLSSACILTGTRPRGAPHNTSVFCSPWHRVVCLRDTRRERDCRNPIICLNLTKNSQTAHVIWRVCETIDPPQRWRTVALWSTYLVAGKIKDKQSCSSNVHQNKSTHTHVMTT